MRRVYIGFLAIVICILIGGCSSRNNLNDRFDAYETETAEKVPYVCFDILVSNGVKFDFGEFLDENVPNGVFHEVYAIQDDVIWFGYSDDKRNENGARNWYIASVSIDKANFKTAYSGEFCLELEADQAYVQNNNSHSKERYLEANGFYYDGKIILTDHVKTVEYDLATGISTEYLSVEYEYPALPIETEIIDSRTISFSKNSEQKIFNVETGSQTSTAFKDLLELNEEKIWSGESCLSDLFDKVQIVNNQAFIMCRAMNWNGETHAIVFQYDFENNSCKYAFHCFMNDIIGNDLYVVPMIENN